MRAFVFTDQALERQAGRFVWLAMNTERAQNASLRKKFPVAALPTYLIVDPVTEQIALRWVGGATLPQLTGLLDAGLAKVGRGPSLGGLDALLARADSLYAAQDDSAAAAAYDDFLAQAPLDWPGRSRIVDAQLFSLQMAGDNKMIVKLANEEHVRYHSLPTGFGLAVGGLDAATSLPKDDPQREEAIARYEAATREAIADTALQVSDDDRSSAYGTLVSARKAVGDSTGARQAAEQWAAFLEMAAARARTPEQRTVFDSHRLSAYLELGEPERAVPMLQRSERELPRDYNPPARLATAYLAMKRWDDALAASSRALARAYGPRKLRILQTRADIYAGKGDAAAARRTLEQALATAEALPPGQRSESTIAAFRKKLAEPASAATP